MAKDAAQEDEALLKPISLKYLRISPPQLFRVLFEALFEISVVCPAASQDTAYAALN